MAETSGRRFSAFFDGETARRAGFISMFTAPGGGDDPVIRGLEYDSRKAAPGTLYFALPGLHADGHDYIADAVGGGASAVLYQHDIPQSTLAAFGPALYIRLADSRFAMSVVADSFYRRPSQDLIVAGVTGTEGKSTTASLIWQFLRLAGEKAGFISTVQTSLGGDAEWNSEHQTTPEATTVHAKLAAMRENGVNYAVLEASSHGLSPRTNRLGDVVFDAGVMTAVTHEHLEFHGTWEQYRSDKANLFRAVAGRAAAGRGSFSGFKAASPVFGVVNADDESAAYFAEAAKGCPVYSFSVRGGPADLSVQTLESFSGGNRYRVSSGGRIVLSGGTALVEDRLPGAFNAGNVLAALLAVSQFTGKPPDFFIPLAGKLTPLRGRMTPVNRGQPFEVIVDYAHTPSSFLAVFPPLRERLSRSGGRLISVFGSAGERDTAKRPLQGRIAGDWSDIVVLADEDPRGEVPMRILEEIAAGCTLERENVFLVPERDAAIRKAFSLARKGDLVLLLGKGHENSIIYERHSRPWDEIAEAEKALGELGFGG